MSHFQTVACGKCSTPTIDAISGLCISCRPVAAVAEVAAASDLSKLTRYMQWRDGNLDMVTEQFGVWVRFADVERLLVHQVAQAPVEPVTALTDEQINTLYHKYSLDGSMIIGSRFKDYVLPFARALLATSPKVEPVSEDKRDACDDVLPLDAAAVTAAVTAWRESTNHPAGGNIDRVDIGRAIAAYLGAIPSTTKEST